TPARLSAGSRRASLGCGDTLTIGDSSSHDHHNHHNHHNHHSTSQPRLSTDSLETYDGALTSALARALSSGWWGNSHTSRSSSPSTHTVSSPHTVPSTHISSHYTPSALPRIVLTSIGEM